jgi:hypothetical protein
MPGTMTIDANDWRHQVRAKNAFVLHWAARSSFAGNVAFFSPVVVGISMNSLIPRCYGVYGRPPK